MQTIDWELTANHYLAVPMIATTTGAIHSVTALHRAGNGLIEWAGSADRVTPLLHPAVSVDGNVVQLNAIEWERLDRWIPRFRQSLHRDLTLTGTICAPIGYEASRRGFFYTFELENRGADEHEVRVALTGVWGVAARLICTTASTLAERTLANLPDREGIALEISGAVNAALGVAVFGRGSFSDQRRGDDDFSFELGRTIRIGPQRRASVTFYVGAAQEREGALATAGALRRLGADRLLRESRLDLSRIARKKKDAGLAALLNRNLVFTYFFACGRALDDDRLYPVTSRSPLHPRCGTFNERDALLWSLPAIAMCDQPLAREFILRCFEQYSHRPGEAIRYVDGTVLEPGLALDQWCAYALAVDYYVRTTSDSTLAEETLVRDVLRELDAGMYPRLHPEVFLGATELQPSGEAADQPYLTYDNALLHSLCRVLQKMAPADSDEARRLGLAADELNAAVWRRLTVDVKGEALLAWSTDLEEAASVYDDPAGSLQWLPYFGFCDRSEPIWSNTMQFLRSKSYPLWLGDRKHPGLASRARPQLAVTAALCADLLGNRTQEALRVLRTVILPSSVGCTHYDPDDGIGTGALHDAGVAGLLAWTLHESLKE